MVRKRCCMNEYAETIIRFADDLHEIGASLAERKRGADVYLQALVAPSTATWRSFYDFVFAILIERRSMATALESDAVRRLVALVEDDFGAKLFGGSMANALQCRPAKHEFHEASVPS
jgi:hypothetical protein